MRLKEFFFPKRRDFLGMLVRQTDKTLEGMKALKEFMKEPNPTPPLSPPLTGRISFPSLEP